MSFETQRIKDASVTSGAGYREKLQQANREARASLIGLCVVIVIWCACGFGLAQFDLQIFSTPLWVIGGTFGTWIASIVVALVLGKRVFKDCDLDEDALEGRG